jgi:hypothetical protein
MEWVSSAISTILNAGWKIYLAALLASATLLFLPDPVAVDLGLAEIRNAYRTYAGIVLVGSASLIVVQIIAFLVQICLRPWRNWQFNKAVYKTLTELTYAEKDFLREFIFGHANTVMAPINDGVSGGLAAKRIIYRSSNVSHGLDWPYNLQPIPRKLLTEHPDLLN